MEVDRASVEQLAIGYKREPVDPFNFILSMHFVKVTDLVTLRSTLLFGCTCVRVTYLTVRSTSSFRCTSSR